MKQSELIPQERIISKIIILRHERVLLDLHLAELYQVETRVLKQSVRRNLERFPDDFMFELNEEEIDYVVSQSVIPSKSYLGGSAPFAFTETGVAMLSSVLKSQRAIEMNVAIVRTFVNLRKAMVNYTDLLQQIEKLEQKYDGQFQEVYAVLHQLIEPPEKPRKRIGYKRKDEEN